MGSLIGKIAKEKQTADLHGRVGFILLLLLCYKREDVTRDQPLLPTVDVYYHSEFPLDPIEASSTYWCTPLCEYYLLYLHVQHLVLGVQHLALSKEMVNLLFAVIVLLHTAFQVPYTTNIQLISICKAL